MASPRICSSWAFAPPSFASNGKSRPAILMQPSLPTAVRHPTPVGPAEEQHHLNFLDGLRGGAALWVLLAHCMIWGGWYKLPLPDAKIAVDIFMVVSGYLMVYLAEERARQEPPGTAPTIKKFWVRRFFRIAPLYVGQPNL